MSGLTFRGLASVVCLSAILGLGSSAWAVDGSGGTEGWDPAWGDDPMSPGDATPPDLNHEPDLDLPKSDGSPVENWDAGRLGNDPRTMGAELEDPMWRKAAHSSPAEKMGLSVSHRDGQVTLSVWRTHVPESQAEMHLLSGRTPTTWNGLPSLNLAAIPFPETDNYFKYFGQVYRLRTLPLNSLTAEDYPDFVADHPEWNLALKKVRAKMVLGVIEPSPVGNVAAGARRVYVLGFEIPLHDLSAFWPTGGQSMVESEELVALLGIAREAMAAELARPVSWKLFFSHLVRKIAAVEVSAQAAHRRASAIRSELGEFDPGVLKDEAALRRYDLASEESVMHDLRALQNRVGALVDEAVESIDLQKAYNAGRRAGTVRMNRATAASYSVGLRHQVDGVSGWHSGGEQAELVRMSAGLLDGGLDAMQIRVMQFESRLSAVRVRKWAAEARAELGDATIARLMGTAGDDTALDRVAGVIRTLDEEMRVHQLTPAALVQRLEATESVRGAMAERVASVLQKVDRSLTLAEGGRAIAVEQAAELLPRLLKVIARLK